MNMAGDKEEEELLPCVFHNSIVSRIAARFELPDRRRERIAEQSYTLKASGRLHSMQELLHNS